MSLVIVLKILLIVIFLIMFLRRPSLTWGIGLLTVTAAVLIDTLLSTFDSGALQAEMGSFYYVIAGTLFGGATLWLWGLFIPRIVSNNIVNPANISQTPVPPSSVDKIDGNLSGIDKQMLYEEIHNRFGREDVLDLMFDLEINENDVMPIDQDVNHLIVNIMDAAIQEGRSGALALAVERILTPPPPEYLPRLEKIVADSPPTILRQYLLVHYELEDLERMAADLDIDWEQLDAGAKREKTRSLLQFLYHRNRVAELVNLMHERGKAAVAPPNEDI